MSGDLRACRHCNELIERSRFDLSKWVHVNGGGVFCFANSKLHVAQPKGKR